jgi:hypothetical protein
MQDLENLQKKQTKELHTKITSGSFFLQPNPNPEGYSKFMQRLVQQNENVAGGHGNSNLSEGSTGGAPYNDVKRNLFQI